MEKRKGDLGTPILSYFYTSAGKNRQAEIKDFFACKQNFSPFFLLIGKTLRAVGTGSQNEK
jgi:hypothetical protein